MANADSTTSPHNACPKYTSSVDPNREEGAWLISPLEGSRGRARTINAGQLNAWLHPDRPRPQAIRSPHSLLPRGPDIARQFINRSVNRLEYEEIRQTYATTSRRRKCITQGGLCQTRNAVIVTWYGVSKGRPKCIATNDSWAEGTRFHPMFVVTDSRKLPDCATMRRRWGVSSGTSPLSEVYMHIVTDDPELEDRSVDIIGLYLHPPQHAAVFSVDERTAFHPRAAQCPPTQRA